MSKKKNKRSRKKSPNGTTESHPQSSREVYFAILPDKYEPLIEELEEDRGEEEEEEEEEEESPEERRRRKEDKERRKKEKYKKYRKNVGKALRFSWRCLVAGLHSLAGAYASPAYAATAVVIGVQTATTTTTGGSRA